MNDLRELSSAELETVAGGEQAKSASEIVGNLLSGMFNPKLKPPSTCPSTSPTIVVSKPQPL